MPFVLYPPTFPISVGMPLCINVEVGKFVNQIVDLSLQPSSTSHDSDLVRGALEWFMEPGVKTNPSIP